MSLHSSQAVSQALQAISDGDTRATDELFGLVYGELRRIAGSMMAKERAGHTLQPTAVVNEAYLRLIGSEDMRWENRAHFFGAAAKAMRRILVDHARRRASLKRGGDLQRVELEDPPVEIARWEEMLALNTALERLEQIDPHMAKVVDLRYFAGLKVEETAKALATSPRSVNRAWTSARAWLLRELGAPLAPGENP